MAEEMQKRKLSVAMIVRDAADILGDTLKSIEAIADEIVVLDTGSQDSTCELAKEHGANVIEQPWDDSFSLARNAALQHTTGDCVFWLDAGEVMSKEDAKSLRAFVDSEMDMMTAYVMLVKIPQEEKGIGSEQIGSARLFPNHPGIKFTGRVRETTSASLAECGLALDGLPFVIRRGVCEHESKRKMLKSIRNIKLVDMEIKESEPNARLMLSMAEAMQAMNDHANALTFYQQACQLAEHGSTELLEALYGILTTLDGQEGGLEVQIKSCITALEIYPLDAQLLCAMGGYLQSKGQLALAQRSFETAYQHGQVNPETWHIEDIDEIAISCYVLTSQLLGEHEKAEQTLIAAMKDHADSIRLRRQLIDLHVKYGRREEALAEVKLLPKAYPNVESFRSAVRGAVVASQKNWIAARPYLEASYRRDCREPLCMRWYSLTLMALGHQDQATEILNEWKSIDPHCQEPHQLQQMMNPPEPTEQTVVEDQQPMEEIPTDRTIRVDQGDSQPAKAGTRSAAAGAAKRSARGTTSS